MKRNGVTIGLGIPTILVVFIILALSILSTLTYLQASQNSKMADKEVETVTKYYETDTKAQYILHAPKEEAIAFMEKEKIAYHYKNTTLSFQIELDDYSYLDVKKEKDMVCRYTLKRKEN